MSSLNDSTIRAAKPREKRYRLFDGQGLFVIVRPTGGKWWRWKYRFEGRESSLSLGVYPHVSLKDARLRRDEAKKLLANGINPSAHRKAQKAVRTGANSLEHVAREWHAQHAPSWTPAHAAKILGVFEKDIFPRLGRKPISEVTAPELLEVLRRIESRGAPAIAKRCLADLSRVFVYSIGVGRATRNPAADIRGVLKPAQQGRHHASITEPKAVGSLLRAIDGYEGSVITKCALRLAPHVFLRPGELRKMEWQEIDLPPQENLWVNFGSGRAPSA